MLDERRPFFAECWAEDGITMLTVFVSAEGIENESPEEIENRILKSGYFRYRSEEHGHAEVMPFTNRKKDAFYSVNICVGVEGEPTRIMGAKILPWSVLNEYNRSAGGAPGSD